jgi:SAM-dependent methyltransferase
MFKEGSIFLRDRQGDRSEGVFTESRAQRIYERYKRIIGANLQYIEGKTVLDLASNNGRWTWAALDAGASYVLGIEGRQELIDVGLPAFAEIEADRFDFVCGDVYDSVDIGAKMGRTSFDTVLCLGLFYHISDHYRLIRVMRAFNPKCIIIDSAFINTDAPEVRFKTEDATDASMAIAEGSADRALAGRASVGFLKLAAKLSGYDLEFVPWKRKGTEYQKPVQEYLEDNPKGKRRMTARLIARSDKPRW